MRAEKQNITAEYVARLSESPYFIVVDYQGLKVLALTELRKRLFRCGAQIHVVKNSIFKVAAKEAGVADLTGLLSGQLAVVTGARDISAAAKSLKTFAAEFDKPVLRFGFIGNQRLDPKEIVALADLPSLEVLRSKLLGLLNTPATQLVQVLQAPGAQLARVLKAKSEKG